MQQSLAGPAKEPERTRKAPPLVSIERFDCEDDTGLLAEEDEAFEVLFRREQ